ncbi:MULTISPECIES: AEC family transporter [unclassified Polynucleobacter]|uniref:AEC family transporter n=1 Tax=unclassified Polynucleobacter TaxID=2640945 RepID=UPI001BFEB78C|nr:MULTISPECIES: AEC family transporter [unclassified Polynucleobacter]MEA9600702.1 AEC family transporter [Polynucleobacter sp. MG-28-Ekke-A2]QWD81376.1 AEC family transporter [Polynucleobacter sp. MWH-S4W17]
MLYVFNVVLPVFLLILIGYVGGRTGKLGINASVELNRFVVWLALPAQLFNFAANSGWQTLWQPGFITAFFLSCLIVFLLVLLVSWVCHRDLAAASFDSLSASYSNTGYMGIPLCALALGQDGLAPAIISTFIVFVMFALATVLIEIGILSHKKPHEIGLSVIKSLCTNPLLIAPVAGLLWASSDLTLYDPIAQVIAFLAAASTPCALVSIGLFLMQKSTAAPARAWGISLAKLILQPLIAWVIAGPILELPALWVSAIVILSALPTGTGPFMLAQYYKADGSVISRVVLITTVSSLLTLSLFLWWSNGI